MMHARSVARVARTSARQTSVREVSTQFNTKSILQRIFDSSNMEEVPLNEPFPTTPAPSISTKEATKVTKTPTGINVISNDNGQAMSSVSVFVDAGSRYETHENNGISHFLEGMAFKATESRSEFRTVREMLKIGAQVSAHASRESFVLTSDVLRENMPSVLGTFGDVMQAPLFLTHEVAEHQKAYAEDCAARAANPDIAVTEGIHEAAYFNNTLGLPLHAPVSNVPSFTSEALQNYVDTFFRPERLVVAGVNVNHSELVDLTNHVFDRLKTSGPAPPAQKAQYTGGEARMHTKGHEGNVTVAMAFETADWNSKDLVPMCVLQMLMGGGGSFSAGGPGKGMCSRLYERVLYEKPWVENVQCLNWIYSDSGLFGLTGSCHPTHAGELVDVLTKQMIGMAEVNNVELQRAKNQLKSTVLMQLENRHNQMEDLGRQFQTYGKVVTSAELCEMIDAVNPADIKRVATTMLKTPPSLAAHGDLTYLPRYDAVSANFN